MSFLPPPSSPLRGLRVETVLDFYDTPTFFIARNDLGYAFLAIATDEDSTGDVFTYIPVSEDRLAAVRTGLISLRSAVTDAEVDTLFIVRPGAQPESVVSETSRHDFPTDWLPHESVVLSQRLDTVLSFSPERLAQLSRSQNRYLTALEFDLPEESKRTEFPLDQAGALMREFQELTQAFSLYERPASAAARQRADVLRESELALVQVAAASFVFIVAPMSQDRLIQLEIPAVRQASAVLASSANNVTFQNAVAGLKPRTISHLTGFLNALSKASTGVTVVNATPTGQPESVVVALPSVTAGLAILKSRSLLPSETFTVEGHLLAINLIRYTFTIVESHTTGNRKKPRTISGVFESDLLVTLDGLALGPSVTHNFELVREQDRPEYSEGQTPRVTHRLIGIETTSTQLATGTSGDGPQTGQ